MLCVLLLAAMFARDGNPPSAGVGSEQILLTNEFTFRPPSGHLEDMAADGELHGFPATRCEGFAPAIHLWRIGCFNDGSAGKLVVVLDLDDQQPTVLATLDYKPEYLSVISLHDHIVIRTFRSGSDGEAILADYFWKPPRR